MDREISKRLSQAQELVDRGDFLEARRLARAIGRTEGLAPDARDSVARILATTGVDPVAVAILAITAAVILFLAVYFVI